MFHDAYINHCMFVLGLYSLKSLSEILFTLSLYGLLNVGKTGPVVVIKPMGHLLDLDLPVDVFRIRRSSLFALLYATVLQVNNFEQRRCCITNHARFERRQFT